MTTNHQNFGTVILILGYIHVIVLLVYVLPRLLPSSPVAQKPELTKEDSISNKSIEDYINSHRYQLIINEITTCNTQNGNDNILLVIIVCSAPGNARQRYAIRQTWGTVIKNNTFNSRLLFLMGKPKTIDIQNLINNESSRFHDVIHEDFADSYRNLSLKSIAALKWVSTFCKNAQYMLKVDDDIFVNVENLISLLKNHPRHKRFIMGNLQINAKAARNPSSKYFTPKSLYPNETYPKYMSGTAYIISGNIVTELYQSTLTTPLFWLEDIFITALCARKIPYVELINHRGFHGVDPLTKDVCVIQNSITNHYVTPEEMLRIWKTFKTITCNKIN